MQITGDVDSALDGKDGPAVRSVGGDQIFLDVSSRFHTHRSDGPPRKSCRSWVKEIWAPLQRLECTLHCTSSKLLHRALESDSVWTPRTKSDGRMPYAPATATNIKPSWGRFPLFCHTGPLASDIVCSRGWVDMLKEA